MKKALAFLLAAIMLLGMIPMSFAATIIERGTSGNLEWTFDSAGTLTISGEGAIIDYTASEFPEGSGGSNGPTNAPWGKLVINKLVLCPGVTKIGQYAFSYCTHLKSVTIPDSVKTLGNYAFVNCTNLRGVTFGSGVKSIGPSTFGGCANLENFEVVESNPEFYSVDGVLFTKKTKSVLRSPATKQGVYVVPNGTLAIGDKGYQGCTEFTNVTIPDSVTSIGLQAFKNNVGLTSITIGKNVKKIGANAFANDDRLLNIYYNGTELQWRSIWIESGNEALYSATMHYTEQHDHEWDAAKVTTEPSCTAVGVETSTCSVCKMKKAETIASKGHELQYAAEGAVLTETCSRCDHRATATVTAENAVYSGSAIKTGNVNMSGDWAGGELTIEYVNNRQVGTAKAMIARGGVTAVTEFTIEEKPESTLANNTPANDTAKMNFTDVAENAWYNDAVYYTSGKGLMNGVGKTTFAPGQPMTRAMLMTVLARYAGVDTAGGATWYEKGMNWAKESGVSDGTMPEGNITREQLVTMLYRYLKEPAAEGELTFADAGSVSSWAQNAIIWAVANGIIDGVGNNKLEPQGSATRAQVATILMRFAELQK